MSDIKVGQVLSLKIRYNNSGVVSTRNHPYIIVQIADDFVEIAQIDSLYGKEYKGAFNSNHVVLNTDPSETVIDKDSYIQLDNTLRIENHDELVRYRRQADMLSPLKLTDFLKAYSEFRVNYTVDENKQVYMDKEEITSLNP
jgi:hypothetical protein